MKPSYYENIRHDVLSLIPNSRYKKILEIGGGEFPTLKSLVNQFDAEAWGVDLYDSSAEGIKFIRGSIEDLATQNELPDSYFDLIIANDVLEHLLDTESAFKVIYSKLSHGGLFVCSVPNIRQIRTIYHLVVKGKFPREDAGLFDRTHYRWFCRSDVICFGEGANFKLLNYGSSGRLVPGFLQKTTLSEFLALQNLFVFIKQ